MWGPRVLSLIALFLGCASENFQALPRAAERSFKVDAHRTPGADFSKLRSFGWVEGHGVEIDDPRLDVPLLEKQIREAIQAELSARGLVFEPLGETDLRVAYHASVDQKLTARAPGGGYDYGEGYSGAGDLGVETYDAGTLIVDLIAADHTSLLWRGSVETQVFPGKVEAGRTAERVRGAVAAMFGKLPPLGPR